MLGEHIRNLRKEKNITLAQLSQETTLSAGYLSQVERGKVDPSLSSLRKISTALDVPPMLLMDDPFSKNLTLHKNEQPVIGHSGSSTVRYTIMTTLPSSEYMPATLVLGFTLDPRSTDFEKPITHNTEEIVIVNKGQVEVQLMNQSILLKEGDTTIIQKNIPHLIINNSDEPASGLSIMTPAIWSLKF